VFLPPSLDAPDWQLWPRRVDCGSSANKPTVSLRDLTEEHGCELKTLHDYGDNSPEGAVMRGIQAQFAEYERGKGVLELIVKGC
jgi:hypothetical protein